MWGKGERSVDIGVWRRVHAVPEEKGITQFRVKRDITVGRFKFGEVFQGIKDLPVVQELFPGEEGGRVLENLEVEVSDIESLYMCVRGDDAHLVVSREYLREGRRVDIYLDLIHELTHVKQQLLDMKDLHDVKFNYVDRPTEIEAYRRAVEEARRIGMSEDEIAEYLRVEWLSEGKYRKLLRNLRVDLQGSERSG